MISTIRVIIVRRGATDVYAHLRSRFAHDPKTVIMYDRRTGERRGLQQRLPQECVAERRRGERRLPSNDPEILIERGFFATRRRPGRHAQMSARPSPGDHSCASCGAAIQAGDLEHETLTTANVRLRFHGRCRDLWTEEARGEG
jgi:hypothetical protein